MGLLPAYAAAAAAATADEGALRPRLIRRRQRGRLRRSAEQFLEPQAGVAERSDQLAPQRVRVGAIRIDPEALNLAFDRRYVQGSEHPVPEREAATKIFVEMRRIVGVVNLMVRGLMNSRPSQPLNAIQTCECCR